MKKSSLSIRQSPAGGAVFDRTEAYRYLLWRHLRSQSAAQAGDWPGCPWQDGRPGHNDSLLLIMLNPNRADERTNDPTIRRCISFATAWGFGKLEVVNLFAVRAEKPVQLRSLDEPVGEQNDQFIIEAASRAAKIVVAWGNHGRFAQRDQQVIRLLADSSRLYCFGRTKGGNPLHPLYLPADQPLVSFDTLAHGPG